MTSLYKPAPYPRNILYDLAHAVAFAEGSKVTISFDGPGESNETSTIDRRPTGAMHGWLGRVRDAEAAEVEWNSWFPIARRYLQAFNASAECLRCGRTWSHHKPSDDGRGSICP